MSVAIDTTTTIPKHVLMVVANPQIAPTTGWPVGFWAAELTHPYHEFTLAGFDITIASPKGGKLELDAWSDPRHESGYSAEDIISMGFINTPHLMGLLENTMSLEDIKAADFDAIIVCGGQAPMFQFRKNKTLQRLIREFYETEKATAALCHGVSSLIDVQLSDGSYLIEGKTVTGFSYAEDKFADEASGQPLFEWYVEPAMRERGANYIQGGMWKPFAVRDGRLVTGQQQYAGGNVARLMIAAIGQ